MACRICASISDSYAGLGGATRDRKSRVAFFWRTLPQRCWRSRTEICTDTPAPISTSRIAKPHSEFLFCFEVCSVTFAHRTLFGAFSGKPNDRDETHCRRKRLTNRQRSSLPLSQARFATVRVASANFRNCENVCHGFFTKFKILHGMGIAAFGGWNSWQVAMTVSRICMEGRCKPCPEQKGKPQRPNSDRIKSIDIGPPT